jgi:two-component system NtrC family response regulator
MLTLEGRKTKIQVELKKKTILVIDDQSDMGWIMSHIFGDRGDKVIASRSGKEGLRKLNERKDFDLVFLDVKLPDLNGLDVLEQIKKASPHTKVIIITAFGSPEARQQALERGASAFLDKPIQIDEMTRLVDEVLASHFGNMFGTKKSAG